MSTNRNAATNVRASFAVLVLTTVVWLVAGAAASAHAYVVSASPPMNAQLATFPRVVAISFDEPVELFDANAIEVFDATNHRVDLGDAGVDPEDATRVVTRVRNGLPGGVYMVRWRVVSADTHVVHGAYSIAIGPSAHIGSIVAADVSLFDPNMPPASAVRWLALLGAILSVGSIVLCLVALRRFEDLRAAFDRPAHRATVVGCWVVLGAALPSLLVQAIAASAAPLSFESAARTALQSLWGHALIVRVAAATAMLVVVRRRPRDWPLAAAPLAALMLMTFCITGHASAMNGLGLRVLAELNDFTHLAAVCAWIGGILVMAAALPSISMRGERVSMIRRLFSAFTPLAIVCAGVTIATGTIAGFWHVPAASDLLSSAYGVTLSLKVVLVAALLVLGYRQFKTGRGRSDPRAIGALRAEALVALTILACSAILIGQAPPEPRASMASPMQMPTKEGP